MNLISPFLLTGTNIAVQRNDSTVRCIHLDTQDPENYFANFLSVGFGFGLEVPPQRSAFVFDICRELGNIELYESFFSDIESKITKSNVIDRILKRNALQLSCESECGFVASHFFESTQSDLSDLSFDIIASIIGHHSLKLRNEDSLYEFISTFISADSSYSSLLQFMRFEYLKVSSMRHFVNFISASFEILTFAI
jgi:hypothetical protein